MECELFCEDPLIAVINILTRFQWVSLQVSQIIGLERERDVRKKLGSLPKGLTAAYSEIFQAIKDQEGSKPEIAIRTLQWIFSSKESLKANIILPAVCQGPEIGRAHV